MSIPIPAEFKHLCRDSGVSTEMVLRRFMADLCALPDSGGSDERDMAQSYFARCGWRRGNGREG